MEVRCRKDKGSVKTYSTGVDKVSELIQLLNRLGYTILKVGA